MATAIPLLRDAIRLGEAAQENTIDARKSLASYLDRTGDHEGAVREIRAVIAQQDDLPIRRLITLVEAASILGSNGHFEEANRALDEAASRIGTDPSLLSNFLTASVVVYSAQSDPRAEQVLDRLEQIIEPRDQALATMLRMLHGMANKGDHPDPAALRRLVAVDTPPWLVEQIERTARHLDGAQAEWTPVDFWK